MGEDNGVGMRERARALLAASGARALVRKWRSRRMSWPRRIALALAVLLVVPVVAGAVALRVHYAGDI